MPIKENRRPAVSLQTAAPIKPGAAHLSNERKYDNYEMAGCSTIYLLIDVIRRIKGGKTMSNEEQNKVSEEVQKIVDERVPNSRRAC